MRHEAARGSWRPRRFSSGRLTATLLATAVAAAAAAAPASATTMACSFDFPVGWPGVPLVGGSFIYETAPGEQRTTCQVGAGPPAPSIIRTTGRFDNIACTSGRARSQWRQRATEHTSIDYGADGLGTGLGPDIREMEYTITFAAGHGALDIESVGSSAETLPVNGRVALFPGGCVGVAVLRMQGELVASWNGIP